MSEREEILSKLDELSIPYHCHDHQPIMTVEEGKVIAKELGSFCVKNLFLAARKKQIYLLMLPADKSFSSKALAQQLGCGHISFASPEKMAELLHTFPGAVTCLGLLYDTGHAVKVLVDRDLLKVPAIDCHPCTNAASVKLATRDVLKKWLPATGHGDYTLVDI